MTVPMILPKTHYIPGENATDWGNTGYLERQADEAKAEEEKIKARKAEETKQIILNYQSQSLGHPRYVSEHSPERKTIRI